MRRILLALLLSALPIASFAQTSVQPWVTTGVNGSAAVRTAVGNGAAGSTPMPVTCLSGCSGSGATPPGGTNGQTQYNNNGAFAGYTVGGDGVLNTATGALTVLSTNGSRFASSATTDTTNAANISSGTLSSDRITGTYSGLTGTGILTAGATGRGFTIDLGSSTIAGKLPLTNITPPGNGSSEILFNDGGIASADEYFSYLSSYGELDLGYGTITPNASRILFRNTFNQGEYLTLQNGTQLNGSSLSLPADTQNDTLATLGLAQTFSQPQTISLAGTGANGPTGQTLQVTTAATSSLNQASPSLTLGGAGWASTPAVSQPLQFSLQVRPTTGTTAVGGNLIVLSSVNGGSQTQAAAITPDGYIFAPKGLETAGGITGASLNGNGGSNLDLFAPAGNNIGFGVNTTEAVDLNASAIWPATTGTVSLGQSANRWSTTYTGNLDANGGQIVLTNGTQNLVSFSSNGTAPPGGNSVGEKIQLYGSSSTISPGDYAIGVGPGQMWFNEATSSTYGWYSNSNQIALLDSVGNFNSNSDVTNGTSWAGQTAGQVSMAGAASTDALTVNGIGRIYTSSGGGLKIQGNGTTNDFTLVNGPGPNNVAWVAHGTTVFTAQALQIAGLGAGTLQTDGSGNVTAVASASALKGTTASIGGSLLTAGSCAAGTATVTGATTAMTAVASPAADPQNGSLTTGVSIYSYVSAANTVTVRVCALVALTPTATTYNVRVIQ